MAKTMKIPYPPQTDSITELARFWDEHDLTDFEDALEEVSEPVFQRDDKAAILIHLHRQDAERLKMLASEEGVDYVHLIQAWVIEKLQAA